MAQQHQIGSSPCQNAHTCLVGPGINFLAVDPTLLAIKSLNNSMKTAQDPFKTTVKGMQNSANVVMLVRRIQNKIIDRGLCSDQEMQYLREHTNWDNAYASVASNLG